MNAPDYLSRLRQKNEAKTQRGGTDKTDKRPFVSLVSSPLVQQTANSAASNEVEDSPTTSRWWLIHYLDRDPLEICCAPTVSRSWILEHSAGAVSAEPLLPPAPQTAAPITADEQTAIRAWLSSTGEHEPEQISAVMDSCRADPQARRYFVRRSEGWDE
jgi:hypothetical protein